MKFHSHQTIAAKKQWSRWTPKIGKVEWRQVGKDGIEEFTENSLQDYGVTEEYVIAAIKLLNLQIKTLPIFGENVLDVSEGDPITIPTATFFVDKKLDALLTPAIEIVNGVPDAWFDDGGELHVSAPYQNEANLVASKWFRYDANKALYFWNGGPQNYVPTLESVDIAINSTTTDIQDHIKQAENDQQLKDELKKLQGDLRYGIFDWVVTDKNVDDALGILKTASDRNYMDFAWLALQLKNENLINRIFNNISADHISKYPDLIIRLAYFQPLDEIPDTVMTLIGASQDKLLADSFSGPFDMALDQVILIGQLKASVRPLENIKTFFDFKLYEITYNLEKGNMEYVKSILQDVYFFIDMVLEELFSEGPEQSELAQDIYDRINDPLNLFWPIKIPIVVNHEHEKWEPKKKKKQTKDKTKNGDNDSQKNNPNEEITPPITYTKKVDGKDVPVDPMGNIPEQDTTGNPSSSNTNATPTTTTTNTNANQTTTSTGATTPVQTTATKSSGSISKLVTEVAAIAANFFTNLNALTLKYHDFADLINKEATKIRETEKLRLTDGVVIKDTDELTALSEAIKNKLTWYDISKIWLWEIGAETNVKIGFGADARTTKDLQKEPAIIKIITDAKARAQSGNLETLTAFVSYNDVHIFMNSVMTRNIPMNFLGSFTVTVTILPDNIELLIYNESTWASATRFGSSQDSSKPVSEQNPHTSVIDSDRKREGDQEKRKNEINVGGKLIETWTWDEAR